VFILCNVMNYVFRVFDVPFDQDEKICKYIYTWIVLCVHTVRLVIVHTGCWVFVDMTKQVEGQRRPASCLYNKALPWSVFFVHFVGAARQS